MADRRTARLSRFLDPVFRDLLRAAWALYGELEPGAVPVQLALSVHQGSDAVSYMFTFPHGPWLERYVAGLDDEVVDATPPETAEGMFDV